LASGVATAANLSRELIFTELVSQMKKTGSERFSSRLQLSTGGVRCLNRGGSELEIDTERHLSDPTLQAGRWPDPGTRDLRGAGTKAGEAFTYREEEGVPIALEWGRWFPIRA
jgi:hypothetical protein